jgi:transaldolase/glucose-6-phosphate isomerase
MHTHKGEESHVLLKGQKVLYPLGDRLFVKRDPTSSTFPPGVPHSFQNLDNQVLVAAGYPVIRIDVPDLVNLGEEFFRWEMATAVAGALLELNAFDQPNVQESKDNTSFLLESYQQNGALPADEPSLTQEGIQLYVDLVNAQDLSQGSIKQVLSGHLARIRPGDYVAINAYLPHTDQKQQF